MTAVQIAYLAGIFIVVTGAAFGIMRTLAPRPTKARLEQISEKPLLQEKADEGWRDAVVRLFGPLANLARPNEGGENSALRTRFVHAGYPAKSAPVIYFASKTVLALALPGI